LSSREVIEQADKVMRGIVEAYLAPNKTIRDVVADALKDNRGLHQALNPLRDFSNACRDEFRMQEVAPRPR